MPLTVTHFIPWSDLADCDLCCLLPDTFIATPVSGCAALIACIGGPQLLVRTPLVYPPQDPAYPFVWVGAASSNGDGTYSIDPCRCSLILKCDPSGVSGGGTMATFSTAVRPTNWCTIDQTLSYQIQDISFDRFPPGLCPFTERTIDCSDHPLGLGSTMVVHFQSVGDARLKKTISGPAVCGGNCPSTGYGGSGTALRFSSMAPPSSDTPTSSDAAPLIETSSGFAVVTLAVGKTGQDLLSVSGQAMRIAAEKWGADFHVIDGDDTEFNIGEKMRLYEYVKAYKRLFYIDADAIIMPDCPNPFDTFPTGFVYAHDDLKWLHKLKKDTSWLDEEVKQVCESQGWEYDKPFTKYWNSGVWLVDQEHCEMFKPAEKPYPVFHCSEQHLVNKQLLDLGFPVVELGRKWNWQKWVDNDMRHTQGVNIMHFSGMASHGSSEELFKTRIKLMKKYAPKRFSLSVLCEHRGKLIERAGCGCGHKHTYICDKGLGVSGLCVPTRDCGAKCPGFESQDV